MGHASSKTPTDISALVSLTKDGSPHQKERAAWALSDLSFDLGNQVRIAAAEGIAPLVTLLRDGDSVPKEIAAGVLWKLSLNSETRANFAASKALPVLVSSLLTSGNSHESAGALWALASDRENGEAIADMGGLFALVDLVRRGNTNERQVAAGALWALSGSKENQAAIAALGGIRVLVTLASDRNCERKENALGVLWNLAYSHPVRQDEIAACGAIDSLVELSRTGTFKQKELATGVLGFISRFLSPQDKVDIAANGGVEALLIRIDSDGRRWNEDTVVALHGICSDGNDVVRSTVKSLNGQTVLTNLLKNGDEKSKELAAHLLWWLTASVAELSKLCEDMDEAEPLCRHVLARLQDLQSHGNISIPPLINGFGALLHMNAGKRTLIRVLNARAVLDRLADMHGEIDKFDISRSSCQWKSQWEVEGAAMKQTLFDQASNLACRKLIHNLSSKTIKEVLGALIYEYREKRNCYSVEEFRMLRKLVLRIVSSSTIRLPSRKNRVWFIPRNDVHVDDEAFCCGAFGKIFRGRYLNADVVIKCVETGSDDDDSFMREVGVWHEARHPNIVQLYGACHVGEPRFMVCKYISGGSLPEYLYRQKRQMPWRSLLDVTHGLQFLHSINIIHGDLQGNNILVDGDTAMLTDFGMSFFNSGAHPKYKNVGAIRWRAPEFVERGPSFEADIYSLGMCIVEAVTGRPPWGSIPDLAVSWHLNHGKFLRKPNVMSEKQWALVCGMCHFDPSRRLALGEVEKQVEEFAQLEEEAKHIGYPPVDAA